VAKLSNHEILNLAYKVGWRDADDLTRVLSIVLAESGGNTEATSYTGCCHGLMQINTRVHKQWTTAEMKQAEPNMRAGFALWQQSGWQPWNSSRGGQLLRRPEAIASASTWQLSPDIGGPPGTGVNPGKALENAIPGLEGLSDALEKARKWVATPANIGRLAVGILGAVIIVAGLAVLARPAVESTIKTVSPVK
jgi:Lysozyme like domain